MALKLVRNNCISATNGAAKCRRKREQTDVSLRSL